MAGPFQKFIALPAGERRLLLIAFWRLYAARRDLGRKPLRELLPGLGPAEGPRPAQPEEAQRERARAIAWAVRTASAHAPWKSACLVQVLAARAMLRHEGIPGVVFIGAAQGESPDANSFGAHAWLTCGDDFVTGEAGHERFTVIAVHRW